MRLRGIGKAYGSTGVLHALDLDVRAGEFLTLVGPSGCGKSTLLRIIAGLEVQDAGSVEIGDRSVDDLLPGDRDVAMVFQSYALYPHLSVGRNIATPLEMQRLTLAERLPLLRSLSPRRPRIMRGIRAEVAAVAAQLRIDHLLERKPGQLSGGQRQRVALGRAMVRQPRLFLMDEPLSNLDAKLRVHMRGELADLHARLGATFVYVTHDQAEAMTMSDRIALMDSGRILQLGTPADLYDRPGSLAVAQFIGGPPINVIDALADGGGGVSVGPVALPVPCSLPAGTPIRLGIRPEAVELAGATDGESGLLPARLHRAENLGAEWILQCVLAGGDLLAARLSGAAYNAAALRPGSAVLLRIDGPHVHVFDVQGRRVPASAVSLAAGAA